MAELRALIGVILADAPEEHDEVLAVAMTDPSAALACFRAWRVSIPGREPFAVQVIPASTASEMRAQYPGAKVEAA